MAEQFRNNKNSELDPERLAQLERERAQFEEAKKLSEELYQQSELREKHRAESKKQFSPEIPGITSQAEPSESKTSDPISELNGPLGRGVEKLDEIIEQAAAGKISKDNADLVDTLSAWIGNGEETHPE